MSKCETLLLPCTAQAQSGAGGVYARAEQGSRAAAAALLLPKEGWGGAGRGGAGRPPLRAAGRRARILSFRCCLFAAAVLRTRYMLKFVDSAELCVCGHRIAVEYHGLGGVLSLRA